MTRINLTIMHKWDRIIWELGGWQLGQSKAHLNFLKLMTVNSCSICHPLSRITITNIKFVIYAISNSHKKAFDRHNFRSTFSISPKVSIVIILLQPAIGQQLTLGNNKHISNKLLRTLWPTIWRLVWLCAPHCRRLGCRLRLMSAKTTERSAECSLKRFPPWHRSPFIRDCHNRNKQEAHQLVDQAKRQATQFENICRHFVCH